MADLTREEILALASDLLSLNEKIKDKTGDYLYRGPGYTLLDQSAIALRALAKSMDAEPDDWIPTATAKWLSDYEGSACAIQTAVHNQPIKSDGGVPFYLSPPVSAPAEPVAVKALEFGAWPDDGSRVEDGLTGREYKLRALSPFGAYFIKTKGNFWFVEKSFDQYGTWQGPSEASAIAYASNDYESRIRSSLAEQPAPVAEAGAAATADQITASPELLAEYEKLKEQVASLSQPGWYWDADDGENACSDWADLLYDADYEAVVEVKAGMQLPWRKWAASRCLTVDEHGMPDEIERELFDTEAEARACWPDSLAAARKVGEAT